MKAKNITEPGFYWYSKAGDWTIVHVDDYLGPKDLIFTHTGNDHPFMGKELSDSFPGDFIGPLEPPERTSTGCQRPLAPGQHWSFCGETDMGATDPALCVNCGGSLLLADVSARDVQKLKGAYYFDAKGNMHHDPVRTCLHCHPPVHTQLWNCPQCGSPLSAPK